jgi:glycosyltransferase involved in cell wall biosynthesis
MDGASWSGVQDPASPSPRVSIVVPCFNSAGTLADCLSSIVAQWREALEIIVIDGGSTDGTQAISAAFGDRIAHFSSEPDRGVYDAMNKGVQAARGTWILFLGSDDTLHPQFFRCLDLLEDDSALYYGDVVLKSTGASSGGRFDRFRLQFRNICHQAILYPRSAFLRRSFDQDYRVLGDHEFNLYCMGRLKLRFIRLPLLMATYNDLSGVSHLASDPAFERDRVRLAFEYFGPVVGWYARFRLAAYRLKRRMQGKAVSG